MHRGFTLHPSVAVQSDIRKSLGASDKAPQMQNAHAHAAVRCSLYAVDAASMGQWCWTRMKVVSRKEVR